jgi:hypothetical protein
MRLRHDLDRAELCGMADYILSGGVNMKFIAIKLPRFLGGMVKAILNAFSKKNG